MKAKWTMKLRNLRKFRDMIMMLSLSPAAACIYIRTQGIVHAGTSPNGVHAHTGDVAATTYGFQAPGGSLSPSWEVCSAIISCVPCLAFFFFFFSPKIQPMPLEV